MEELAPAIVCAAAKLHAAFSGPSIEPHSFPDVQAQLRHASVISYLKVSMPSQLWALYKFGVGTGRLRLCDFHAANTPRAARTSAVRWSDACTVFCCCLQHVNG